MITPEQKAAYVQSQAAMAIGEIAMMQAENQQAALEGKPPVYVKEFGLLDRKYCIGHNDVVGYFRFD